MRQSFQRLRDLINTNATDVSTLRWITLTYKENQTDPSRLYQDYRKFWQRFKRYLQRNNMPSCEYIACAEPQSRGAWHLHILYIFKGKAPFIPNDDLAEIWGLGFTKTKALDSVDNIGIYLTAYLTDIPLEDTAIGQPVKPNQIKMISGEGDSKTKKSIIKGGRLHLYPVGFRFYRCSRGVKRPTIENCTFIEAQKKLKSENATLSYERTIQLRDDDDKLINTITYLTYKKPLKRGDPHA